MDYRRRCKDCIFLDSCGGRRICEDFSPLTEEIEEYLLLRKLPEERIQFEAEWEQYIDKFYND